MARDPDPNMQITLDPTGGSGSTTLFHTVKPSRTSSFLSADFDFYFFSIDEILMYLSAKFFSTKLNISWWNRKERIRFLGKTSKIICWTYWSEAHLFGFVDEGLAWGKKQIKKGVCPLVTTGDISGRTTLMKQHVHVSTQRNRPKIKYMDCALRRKNLAIIYIHTFTL
jgi:hypothetical protein